MRNSKKDVATYVKTHYSSVSDELADAMAEAIDSLAASARAHVPDYYLITRLNRVKDPFIMDTDHTETEPPRVTVNPAPSGFKVTDPEGVKELLARPIPSGTRGDLLLEAHTLVNGDRQDRYGKPEDSFLLIAKYWNTFLNSNHEHPLTPRDVAVMMVLFKLARYVKQHDADSITDAAGYLGLAGDLT